MNCRPKYLPGKYLKGRWNGWNAGRSYGQVPNSTSPNHEIDTAYHGSDEGRGSEMDTTNNAAGVRRDTSIRSTITLPPYSSSPKPEEQIIAREGERGGMDVVVEFPETAEEEESRRDELMETLYQIRVQRRQENAEREARRQERRDARARGDFIRLEELRLQSFVRDRGRSSSAASASNPNPSASTVLAEHQSRGRERRIASVNYAALGRVRHDGSRLRHNSNDSDNRPLLQNAASIHEDGSGNPISHFRGDSYSSLVSGSSVTSDGYTLTPVASQRPSMHSARSRSDSRPTSIPEEESTGAENAPAVPPPPPEYDHLGWGEVPAYTSPVAERFDSSARDGNANEERTETDATNNTAATAIPAAAPASGNGAEAREHGSQGEQEEPSQNNEETSQGIQRSQAPAPLPLLPPLPAIQIDIASPISDLTPTTPTQPQSREQAPERPAEDSQQQQHS